MIVHNKNYGVSLNCPKCGKPLNYYLNFHPEQGQIKYGMAVCYHCGEKIKLIHGQYKMNDLTKNENEINPKMAIRKKHENTDSGYLVSANIGKYIGDSITVIIGGEGELNTTGKYGDKWAIPILYEKEENGKKEKFEKTLNLNKVNENTIIGLFGEESKEWVEKRIKLVIGSFSLNGKATPMIQVSEENLN